MDLHAVARLRLADQFYLLARDDWRGRLLLPERIFGLGAGGALLVELALDGFVALDAGRIVVRRDDDPGDHVLADVIKVLRQEPVAPLVRDLLAFLAHRAAAEIAIRLAVADLVTRQHSRMRLRPGTWVPKDANTAATVGVLLSSPLLHGEQLSVQQAALAGLVRATGLERDHKTLAEIHEHPAARARLDAVLAQLAPSLIGALLDQIAAAVAGAVATHRVR